MDKSPLQYLVDGMNAGMQRARAETQLTLGDLIEALSSMDPETMVTPGLGRLDSYRGYYEDLAFAPSELGLTAGQLLELCRAAMGQVFQGYKGGNYVMGATTPLWRAEYGSGVGERIVSIDTATGELRLERDDP